MKLNLKEVGRPALILMLICLIVTAALGGVDALTRDTIAQQQAEAEQAARVEVLPNATEFKPVDGRTDVYAGLASSGEVSGYVIVTEASGYGAKLRVMTGIGTDGCVTGVTVLSHEETVGLGANCTKEEFRDQFADNPTTEGYTVYKPGATPPAEGGIEALTGATITSNAVVQAVNHALTVFQTITGGKAVG